MHGEVIPAPALSPAVKEEPCSPEPEQEQSDDEPALPHAAQAAHAAQAGWGQRVE